MEIQVKLSQGAILPSKAHEDDTGYDLSLINIVKVILTQPTFPGLKSVMFDTGVSDKPPVGYYYEVVPRSSFSNTGFEFVNCVGVIDSGYRGTIKVVLKGYDLENFTLPYRGFQMILRKFEHATIRQVDSLDEHLGFGKCGGTKTYSYAKQVRSCDEGMSVFVTCVMCKNKWMHSG